MVLMLAPLMTAGTPVKLHFEPVKIGIEVIKSSHLETEIVRPTLIKLAEFDPRLYNEGAVKLMMGTAAQESDLGFYLRQHPRGPGKGWWSVEDATHTDIWRYLAKPSKTKLRDIVLSLARDKSLNPHPPHSELIDNPPYSLAVARIKYWMISTPMPDAGNLLALGGYWDKFYNVNPVHGTAQEFVDSYNKYVK